jgi:hypothetical protein
MDSGTVIDSAFELIELDGEGGSTVGVELPGTFSYSDITNKITFTPGSLLNENTWYRVTCDDSITDETGNPLAADYVFEFLTEENPSISGSSPSSGSQTVPVSQVVRITFDKDMNAGMAGNVSYYTFVGQISGPVTFSASYDVASKVVTLTPSSNLNLYERYDITVLAALEDNTGSPLGTDYSIYFTTDQAPEVITPFQDSVERGYSRTADIMVTFSKEMDETTFTEGVSFIVEVDGAVPQQLVDGELSFLDDPVNKIAVFVPTEPLEYQKRYKVTVTIDVQDKANIPLVSEHVHYIETLASEDFNEPTAINNHITSDSEDLRIFIPEPPKGPNDKITVQIFTATGRKVATLVDNRPYSEILAQLPLIWTGDNEAGRELAPGLYIIQIKATDFKKVLKVMITR